MLPLDYAIRNLLRSPLRLALTLAGSVLVVALVLAAGGFVRGMQLSLAGSGQAGNVLLLGAGSEDSLERSAISAQSAGAAAAGLRGLKETLGVPHASAEVHLQTEVRSAADGPLRPAALRGVTTAALLVHPAVQVTEGRWPTAGQNELLVGRLAAVRMGLPDADLAVGRSLWLDGREWTIVGRFAAPGSVADAEVWLPLTDLQQVARRDTLTCVVVGLGTASFEDVDLFVKQRLDLELVAIPEQAYYGRVAAFFAPIRVLVWATAGLMALGGLLGGLNTMYAAFASRVREVGMLQTLGYRRRAIVLSLVQESLVASSAGALIAVAGGLALLDGWAVPFSGGAFGLRLDGPVVAAGLVAGLGLGVVGALPAAWRCLRLPIPSALRSF